eukprot:evm.model.scf_117.1 EVM.evm.TU.scf_117.1   scf_117:15787-16383(-)
MVKKRSTGGGARYRESYKRLKAAKQQAPQPQEKKQSAMPGAPSGRDASRRASFLAKVASSAAASLHARPAITKRKSGTGRGASGGASGRRARRRGRNPLARLADLSSALDCVDDELKAAAQAKAARAAERARLSARTMRSTRRLVAAESERMRAVMADEAFKRDPFGEVARMLGEALGPPPPKGDMEMATEPVRKAGM